MTVQGLIFGIFVSYYAMAATNDVVHHPAPKEPIYLKSELYDSLKARVPSPPESGSASQKSDEKELLELQRARTNADCEQAKTEVFVSLKSFYGQPRGPLKDSDVEKLTAFFEQVRNDGDFFIQKMKKDFPRPRPFLYMKEINPCVPKEVTGAYPSGHAVLSKLYASILSDLYPADREKFQARAKEIGKHRVQVGMHHPSDIESGRSLADAVYVELQKSEKFQTALKEYKSKL